MTTSKRTMTRYLLGELSEDERAALERRYFEHPRLFDALTRAEAALVDDHAGGRLDEATRRRFEEFYLAHPERRERAAFAAALASRIEREAVSVARAGDEPRPGWLAAIEALRRARAAAGIAVAALVLLSCLVWYAVESRRPDPGEAASGPAAPAAVTLALLVDPDVRSHAQGSPATLVIPSGTAEVRLELSLREREYSAYRVLLRPVGEPAIMQVEALKPSAPPGPAFTLRLPAGRFRAGDYLLTLQGEADGEVEDLSQTLIRVETR